MLRHVALVMILPLAGCLALSPAEPPPASDFAALPVAERFATYTKIDAGGDAETSHVVSEDGQLILACSHGGFTQPSPLWVSEDGGSSFRRLEPTPSPPVGGDCDVAMTPDGSWYMIYDNLASISVVGTSDKGATWRFSHVTSVLIGNGDRPWIQPVGNDLYVTYSDLMSNQPILLLFSKSVDQGRTWSVPDVVTLPPNEEETNCWVGHMVTSEEGRRIEIPLNCWFQADIGSPSGSIYLATSTDAGATWTLPLITTGIGVPTASLGSDGTLWLSYVSPGSLATTMQVVARLPGATTFVGPMYAGVVRDAGFDWPWIDARGDGTATVTWMDAYAKGSAVTMQPYVARMSLDTMSSVFDGPIGNPWTGTTTFEFFMVKHDAAGRAYIVYPLGGDGCKVSPPGTGMGSTRNDLCVHLLRES